MDGKRSVFPTGVGMNRDRLLLVDELGYVPFSKEGAELLFQVLAERHERRSVIITSNLDFSLWPQVFGSEQLTGALLDRLTHHAHILTMDGESFRFRESMSKKRGMICHGSLSGGQQSGTDNASLGRKKLLE